MPISSRSVTFQEALRQLEARRESRVELGLERVLEVLHRLGDPQEKLRIIHVAGTNAKGSVCRMLNSIFCAAGYPSGLYTSPHLYTPLERIEINQKPIAASDFAKLFGVVADTPGQERLTYFELITVIAFLYFVQEQADPVALETGLGGRLDATNVAQHPQLSLITTIGLDHTQLLGSTLLEIAREKGGIFKEGAPVLIGRVTSGVRNALKRQARQAGASGVYFLTPQIKKAQVNWRMPKQRFRWKGSPYSVSLLGRHQLENAQLALEAVEILRQRGFNITPRSVSSGLTQAKLAGRWQLKWVDDRPWVFDVGHNLQAIEAFLAGLRDSPWRDVHPKTAIVSFMRDKNYLGMIAKLHNHFDQFILVPLESDRAANIEELKKAFDKGRDEGRAKPGLNLVKEVGGSVIVKSSIGEAVDYMRGRPNVPFIAVVGSFRLVAPALSYLE